MNVKKQKQIELGTQIAQFVLNLIFVFWAFRWLQKEKDSYEAKIVLWGFVAQLIPQIFVFLLKLIAKHDKKKLLNYHEGKKINNQLLDEELPDTPRVAVLGIGNVGKTTLISSILQKEHQDETTYGKTSYILKLKDGKHVALLDGTGQSHSTQNDNAINSSILLIILDHNESKSQPKLNSERLERHKEFLIVLKDRLQSRNHTPEWIHFLFNKKDLWDRSNRKEKEEIKLFFDQQVKNFQDIYPMVKLTHDFHSNNQTNDCSRLISKISQHLE